MSSEYFIRKLEHMCDDARQRSSEISATDVLVHTAKYLDSDSHLFTEDGQHLFSLSDTIPRSGMIHIFNTSKDTPSFEFLHSLDASSNSPYHYAATYHLDDVFHHITKSKTDKIMSKNIDHNRVKSLCLHTHPDTNHTVSSILVEKDRMHILASCLSEALNIDPFQCEFEDIYTTWLHDSILCDAKSTANYLQRCHKRSMTTSLKRGMHTHPYEHLTPMDIVLSAPHSNQMYYVDIILKDFIGGYKLGSTKMDMVLGRLRDVDKMTSEKISEFVGKCLLDTIFYKHLK